ncbi:hypothetical protein BMWSH_2719 [Priestia megaterium WSH-002]|uniref:Uncharacterized protein n=1 Tax=Priestia megaterium (strain WSH-002) TaxID=1006007 RepID=A0A8D4BKL5_PRIMW|nr:hypothetical protein BMWSH_2719 [Priestia megaterium WSH-002]
MARNKKIVTLFYSFWVKNTSTWLLDNHVKVFLIILSKPLY